MRRKSLAIILTLAIIISLMPVLTLSASAAVGAGKIYYTESAIDHYHVHNANLSDGPDPQTLYDDEAGTPDGVAVDVENGYLYFSDPHKLVGEIYRYNLSTGLKDVLISGVYANDLAIDTVHNKIYFTESQGFDKDLTHYRLMSANLSDGSSLTTLYGSLADPADPAGTPTGVAVDAAGGYVYFSDSRESVGKIFRCNLDGSGRTPLITGVYANDLALDTVHGKIYYTESQTVGADDATYYRLRWANLSDGSDAETLYGSLADPADPAGTPTGVAVDAAGGYVYFSDSLGTVGKVFRCRLDGTDRTELITGVYANDLAIPMADTTAPTVAFTSINSTGKIVTLTFSEALDATTAIADNFTGTAGTPTVAYTVGATTLTLTYDTAIAAGSGKTIIVGAGVKDVAGNAITPVTFTEGTTSGFTGLDTTPPSSPTYSPVNDATFVSASVAPTLTFSEALYSDASGTPMGTAPTGVIKVFEGTSNTGVPLEEGSSSDNSHFTVAYNSTNKVFTVSFGAGLKYYQSYYVELQANKIYDAAGNPIASAEGVSFKTTSTWASATTGAANAVTSSGATLNGTVNANGASTAVYFEYGTTTTYGSYAAAVPAFVTGTSATSVSCSLSGLAVNTTYHYRVKGESSHGTSFGDDMTFSTDFTAPTILSASRTDNTHITVTLSELCRDLDKANDGGFTVKKTGSDTSYPISATAVGDGASHVVLTVADISSAGAVGLTVTYAAGGNGTLADIAGNVLASDNTGKTIPAWDTAAPTVSSINRNSPTSETTNSTSVKYRVTFSETVTGVGTSDFTLTKTNTASGTISLVSAVSGSDDKQYDVTVNSITGAGTLRLDLNSSATDIADSATNAISGGFITGQTYTIDLAAPTILSASRTDNTHITVTLSELCQSLDKANNGGFTVKKTGSETAYAVSATAAGEGNTVVLTVADIGTAGSAGVTVTYATGGNGTIADTAGNALATTAGDTVAAWDILAPTVSSINRSTPASETTNSTSVTFRVTFSETVTGVGTSDFTLTKTNTASGTISLVSAVSGSDDKQYDVTVNSITGAGTLRLDLNSSATDIADSATNAISGGYTGDQTYTIDLAAPVVSSVAVPSDKTYKTDDKLSFTVKFNEAVAVTGAPTLALTLNTGGTVHASYVSAKSTSTALVFEYTIVSGNADADGITVGSLSGGTIEDTAGNSANLTLNSVGTTTGVKVDGIAPLISSVAPPINGTYVTGQNLDYTVSFSKAVNVVVTGGTPYLTLTIGSASVHAVYQSGSGTTLTFRHTLTSGEIDTDGVELGSNVTLNLGTITDTAGNSANLSFAGSTAAGVLVDAVAPTISGVTGPSSGTYNIGEHLNFTATLSENVTVTGAPFIQLTIGSSTVNAVYESGSGTTAIKFRYTIVSGNIDADGIECAAAITLPTGAAIKDAAGNDTETLTFTPPTTTDVKVDGVAPTISSAEIVSGNSYIDIVFSEGIYGAGDGTTALTAANLALTFTKNSGTATNVTISSVKKNDNASEASASALTGGETTVRVFLSITGSPSGAETIEIKPATASSVYDTCGNAMALTETTGAKTLHAPVSYGGDSSDNSGAEVIVNGKPQTAGTSQTTTSSSGQTTTTVTVDTDKLKTILDSQNSGATVTIPITGSPDVAAGTLTGTMVKSMEDKDATLVVQTSSGTYTLPASEIDIDAVSQQLGTDISLSDIKVTVSISEPSASMTQVIESAAQDGGFTIMVPAVDYTITCTHGSQTVNVSSFNSYVERTIAIPDGVDPSKITTGIVVDPNGNTHHVPTRVTLINGKYYAVINSLTNSSYSVVWNPIEFSDVADHWAKASINEMGSRMVVTGVGNNNYAPDRNITRAEFAAIMVRALGLEPGTGESGFTDVAATDWYSGYIKTAASYGIIKGYDNGNFGPNDTISREQAMTMIARAMRITGLTTDSPDISKILASYSDGASVSAYAEEGIAACIDTGIVSGRDGGTIAPKAAVTRAEVAVMVQRLLKKSNLI